MNDIKTYVVLISIFSISIAAQVHAAADPVPCAPAYVQGAVPATQAPDYSYTPDGFLELHFRLTTTKWKYNYGRLLDYDANCNLLIGGIGMWGDKQSYAWPTGVSHVVLRYAEDNPTLPGMYHFNAYNGDTGALLSLDPNSPLGTLAGLYTYLSNRPIHRIIIGNRDAVDFNWDTETGDLISTAALPMKITPAKTPVLIVPGILGTDINKGSEKLWLDLGHNFTDVGDQFMDPLQLNADLTPSDTSLSLGDVIRVATMTPATLVNYDYTDGLIKEFKNQGYVEGTDLFTFPYDWRYGVSGVFSNGQTNVDLLRQKIADIMAQTGSSKVDIVAHSTGGLLVKKDVADHPSDHHIGKAVFVGVPNTGAPKATKVLLSGDGFGIPWLADSEMQKIAKNLPVAYDLLPSLQYVATKGSYVKIVDQGLLGSSSRDLDFGQTTDFLLADHQLNALSSNGSQALHTASFDNFDMRTAGVDLYSINGCKSGTIGNVIERRQKDIFGNLLVSYDQPQVTPGDGTVPLESATNLPIDASHVYYAIRADHGKMPSQNGIRQEIVNLLSGSQLSVGSGLMTQDVSRCKLNGKAISIYSPVAIQVTDALGNRAGVAADGSVENSIPGANFEIMGEHKFVYLPDDEGQMYTIALKGSGEGTFTLQNQNIANDQVTQTEVFADLSVTMALLGQVQMSSASTTLSLDDNGDGVVDQVVQPTAVVYPDTTPPEAIIQFDPVLKDLRFTASDNVSASETVTVADAGGHVVLTDEADNMLDVGFVETNRRSALKASIQSLMYNGQAVSVPSNSFSFSWKLDSQGVLKSLTQVVKSRGGFSIKAVYDGSQTVLTGTDQTGKIHKTLAGLLLLKVSTNRGDFTWTY